MPGNEVGDINCNVYELDNFSGNQWPILDYNLWVERPIQSGGLPNLNLNSASQQLGSLKGYNVRSSRMPVNQNYAQWTPKSEYSRSLTIDYKLNTNETLVGLQNFLHNQNQPVIYGGSPYFEQQIVSSRAFSTLKSHPENECADSPTLTTNSERSEITEASSDYNFHRAQHQFAIDKEVNVPKFQTMQQPGYNDIQLLQKHMMLKQLQEFQRQQQVDHSRQQSPLNQFSVSPRQTAGAQFSPLNGTPVHDNSQIVKNWMQLGVSPAASSVSNKVIFPQEQGRLTSQQTDGSLYGTPVSNAGANMSQYPHFQGINRGSVNLLANVGGQAPKSVMHSSGFGNPSSLEDQGLNRGSFTGNHQESTVPLDPLEAKILYNMDENIWDAFGNQPDKGSVGFGNTFENPDSNSFSSFQCGTWSALMQSAVAEASSSDTGLQEEWSGLTFQNMEQPNDDQMSSFVDSGKQRVGWVDNSFQSASFSSKPFPLVTESSTSSTFPGFHQPGMQFFSKQREDNDSSHESTVNYDAQKPAVHDGEKGQQFVRSDNTWAEQMFKKCSTKHQGVSSGIFTDKSSDGMVDSQHQKSNGPLGNFSGGALNVDKGSIPNFQYSPRASEEVPSRGDHGSIAPTSFNRSVLPGASNVSVLTSFCQSKDDGALKQSVDYSTLARSPRAINNLNSGQINPQLQIHQSGLPGITNRFSPLNQMPSQHTLERMQSRSGSQPFPISGIVPNSHHSNMSVMPQQGESTARPYNVWRNVPTQRQQFSSSPSYLESENSSANISSSILDTSLGGMSPGQDHISNVTTSITGILESHAQPQHIDKAMNNENAALDIQYTTASGSQQFQDNVKDGATVKVPSQENVKVGYNEYQTQSGSKNVLSNHTEHGHDHLQMANSWFKLYGTPKNGQVSAMFDARPAASAALQFPLAKPSQNLHIQSFMERVDGSQDGRVQPGVISQVAVTRPKKRKFMELELVPWNKELMQEIKRPQTISEAEHDWAHATNRLVEKVEMTEVLQPTHRSKRRLVLTTQILQQVICPAPASVFSSDAAANYSIMSYFVSRLSLGDACKLSYCLVNNFLAPLSNSNTDPEKPKSESRSQQVLEIIDKFSDRTKQLENEFERLDKTASFAIIRAELSELERLTVINRFAKFHVRGHMEGTSSSSGVAKVSPQRQVMAIPVPQYIPEGLQCLSL